RVDQPAGAGEMSTEECRREDHPECCAHVRERVLRVLRQHVLVAHQLVRAMDLHALGRERNLDPVSAHPIAPLRACTMPAAANEKNAPMAMPFTCSRACGSPLKYFMPATMHAATPTTDATTVRMLMTSVPTFWTRLSRSCA